MKKFWFFDLDGTLADTDGDIRLAWKAALADLKLDCPDFDRKFITGPSIDEVSKVLFPEIWTEQLALDIRKGFGEHYDHDGFPTTREYPGMLDAVKRIKAAGGRVFIATNKRYAGASVMARKFGWDQVFEALYTGDMHKDDSIGKLRKPALLKLIMAERGARPEECVMVGDTINDFEAAAVNGIESIAVGWGYGTPEERSAASRTIASPIEIPY